MRRVISCGNERKRFFILGMAFVLALASLFPKVAGAVTVEPVGTPQFQVVDTHLYAAPTDSFPSIFPLHFPSREIHVPPYDTEYADGLVLTGFPQGDSFSVSQFTEPSAVHIGYVLIPTSNAPRGSSFDYADGPIIPNSQFPILIQGDVFLNGAPFELNAFNITLPAQAGADGRSHFIVENWENSSFAPPGLASLVGDYEYRLTMRDVNNNGYNLSAQFRVVPEPGTAGLLVPALLACGVIMKRRQSA